MNFKNILWKIIWEDKILHLIRSKQLGIYISSDIFYL